jgi:hypothetical protein
MPILKTIASSPNENAQHCLRKLGTFVGGAAGYCPRVQDHYVETSYTGFAYLLSRPQSGTSNAKFNVPGYQVGSTFYVQSFDGVPVNVWSPDIL